MKIKHALMGVAVCSLTWTLTGCGEDNENVEDTMTDKPTIVEQESTEDERVKAVTDLAAEPIAQGEVRDASHKKQVTLTGAIFYKEVEGGFYAFVSDEGERYTLHGLDEVFQKNGLVVEITGLPNPDLMTTTQFGTVLKVLNVEVLDTSKVIEGHATH
ncbi:ribose-phosphate pyrophosphokinase [Alteromonas sp. 345S023]|uniref:Ribose-phosphate pyrophosphokinase n=1 Tax=Alteromonas profundi TaxID=2696062 RepID=A0A7X5RKI8_9ALTE|nr:ribose-phosphate pyrophosphokinase [Alteromonas profundi]NDV91038.1 ribose-phosphate pyrophosphokinase [Alteromonas profundi]